ncbi:hypothetical protein CEUSTIGMA_g11054.t1 [Chlamydomonas eustigma]|uniref:Methylated-DNA--protein-cysteine methyltransferase n=1 Tax=Chlamydomonas eustigma TaxID=1157962 RepID=A0A250XLG9_9CHLO|nr:hypothetical protein CEUSTIGMA_g11054.t1 [Chlamydomonas eustigma]|eukprot:GAX83630.1 hypothetical protein CEUSTIGMA_g11054.t1 [Chlamydomonas eustigma]
MKKTDREPTHFEKRLYEVCKKIPKGKVSTYGTLANVLKSSARAVGQGMRRNPFAPEVPCHRVVASNLEIGGFSGSWGTENSNVCRKKAMLEAEGVIFYGFKVSSDKFVVSPEILKID